MKQFKKTLQCARWGMLILLLSAPALFAKAAITPGTGGGGITPGTGGGGITPGIGGSNCSFGQICNPLKAPNIQQLIADIISILIQIGIPVAVFFIIYAGFKFVTARGNEEQINGAKKMLLWAIVGTAVLLGASIIAQAIKGTVDQIKA